MTLRSPERPCGPSRGDDAADRIGTGRIDSRLRAEARGQGSWYLWGMAVVHRMLPLPATGTVLAQSRDPREHPPISEDFRERPRLQPQGALIIDSNSLPSHADRVRRRAAGRLHRLATASVATRLPGGRWNPWHP